MNINLINSKYTMIKGGERRKGRNLSVISAINAVDKFSLMVKDVE